MSTIVTRSHAAAVFIETPWGTVSVRDPTKRKGPDGEDQEIFNKCPGGKRDPDNPEETPEETAVREVREETGLVLNPNDLERVCVIPKPDHDFYFYRTYKRDLIGLKQRGNEREWVEFVLRRFIRNDRRYLPEHKKLLIEYYCI